MSSSAPRTGKFSRDTKETSISVELTLDGTGEAAVNTGIGFLDHMLSALAKHARFNLVLSCKVRCSVPSLLLTCIRVTCMCAITILPRIVPSHSESSCSHFFINIISFAAFLPC